MRLKLIPVIFLTVFAFAGCAHHQKPLLPVHDEVLIYDVPYDLAYLRTLDALANVPDWDMETTEKEKGMIRMRNINYSGLTDSDQRTVTFLLKRVDNNRTSLELEKESQQAIGAPMLLKMISAMLNRETQS